MDLKSPLKVLRKHNFKHSQTRQNLKEKIMPNPLKRLKNFFQILINPNFRMGFFGYPTNLTVGETS